MTLRAPHLLLALAVAACAGSSDTPARASASWSPPSDSAIASLLAERLQHNGVGIVVAVVDGARRSIITHGRSGATSGRALDGSTVFQLGSLTKSFTGLLLAEMVTRGEVKLDDPVAQLLPAGVTLNVVGRPITLRDLSTHTSGLPSMPDNFDINGAPDPYEAYTVGQLWSFLSEFKPSRAPGTRYEYSNLGVSLLGRALALKLGTTYEALVTERVLEPLGMTSTSIALDADQQARLAPGHDPYGHRVDEWEMATLQASGSLRSTGEDMLRFLGAHLDSAASAPLRVAAALQRREGASPESTFVALGLSRRADGTYAHAGGKQGYRSGLAFDPGTGIGVVVLANQRTYDSEPMALALHLATGAPLPAASRAPADKPRVTLSRAELARFAGRYRRDDGGEYEVVAAGATLRIRYPNNSIFQFVASGPREFFYDAGNDDVVFDVDAAGRVTGITIHGDGRAEGNGLRAPRIDR